MAMFFIQPTDLDKHKEVLEEEDDGELRVEEAPSTSPPPPLSILMISV
jgi:hypothetical protein